MTQAPGESPKKTKRELTRQQLVDAGFKLFQARGFDAVTVEEIAEAAGVSRRTFFRYFPTKEAVVFPPSLERLETFRQMLRAHTGGARATYTDVKEVYFNLTQVWMANRETLAAIRSILAGSPTLMMHNQMITQQWEVAIALALDGALEGKSEDQKVTYEEFDGFSLSFSARVIAGALAGALRPIILQWYADNCETDLLAMAKEATNILEHGVHTQQLNTPDSEQS